MQERPVLPMLAPKSEGERLNVLSLGAGVQSSTMALMAAHGEITPMPDAAIFADTGNEPWKVYEWVEWLSSPNVLPFPVYQVSAGNILDDTYAALRGEKHGKGRAAIAPFFARGKDGRAAPLRRQCTSHYKIEPVNQKIRRLLGAEKGQRLPKGTSVNVWLGITTDEIYRVKPSQEWFIERRWPLIERRMSRGDCFQWMRRNDYPDPPRSACKICPYRSREEWQDVRSDPQDRQEIDEFDAAIRPGFKRVSGEATTGELWLHRSMKPIWEVDFSSAEEQGQIDMFNNECEGMCGV